MGFEKENIPLLASLTCHKKYTKIHGNLNVIQNDFNSMKEDHETFVKTKWANTFKNPNNDNKNEDKKRKNTKNIEGIIDFGDNVKNKIIWNKIKI